jgi:hypothetical protein
MLHVLNKTNPAGYTNTVRTQKLKLFAFSKQCHFSYATTVCLAAAYNRIVRVVHVFCFSYFHNYKRIRVGRGLLYT